MMKIGRVHLETGGYRVYHQQREDRVLVSLGPLGVRLWIHLGSFSEQLEGHEPNRTLLPECPMRTKPSWYLIAALPNE